MYCCNWIILLLYIYVCEKKNKRNFILMQALEHYELFALMALAEYSSFVLVAP